MTAPFPLSDFVAGRMSAQGFDHRAHVRAGYELLQRHDFADAARVYARSITAMATAAGHPEKFHMTITLAMLSAIAERLPDERSDFDTFAAQHPELFDRGLLLKHYTEERLQCPLARRTFLLPDRR
jgi:hypothetical protein